MTLQAWLRPKNSVAFRNSKHINKLKASQIPLCMGLPGAKTCKDTLVSSLRASIAFEVKSVPWSLMITPGLAVSAVSSRAARRPEAAVWDMILAALTESDAIRDDLEARGAIPVIPTKSNRKVQRPVDPLAYALRNRIERFFNRLMHSRRIATRNDKLANSFFGFLQIASIRLWTRLIHRT